MTIDDYADQQIGPEQFIWVGDDMVIFAKNVADEYVVSASKDGEYVYYHIPTLLLDIFQSTRVYSHCSPST